MLDLCLNYPDRDADLSQGFQFFGLESEQTIISSWINHQVIEGEHYVRLPLTIVQRQCQCQFLMSKVCLIANTEETRNKQNKKQQKSKKKTNLSD